VGGSTISYGFYVHDLWVTVDWFCFPSSFIVKYLSVVVSYHKSPLFLYPLDTINDLELQFIKRNCQKLAGPSDNS
jgi:hypothetical protein